MSLGFMKNSQESVKKFSARKLTVTQPYFIYHSIAHMHGISRWQTKTNYTFLLPQHSKQFMSYVHNFSVCLMQVMDRGSKIKSQWSRVKGQGYSYSNPNTCDTCTHGSMTSAASWSALSEEALRVFSSCSSIIRADVGFTSLNTQKSCLPL